MRAIQTTVLLFIHDFKVPKKLSDQLLSALVSAKTQSAFPELKFCFPRKTHFLLKKQQQEDGKQI